MWEGLLNRFKVLIDVDESKIMHDVLDNKEIQSQIVDLNQKQLYDEGIQADETPTGQYKAFTVAYKLSEGDARGVPGRVDHITGLNTGETYDSMRCVNEPDQIKVIADDRNNFFTGEEANGLGLTEKSLEEIRPEVLERTIDYIRGQFK